MLIHQLEDSEIAFWPTGKVYQYYTLEIISVNEFFIKSLLPDIMRLTPSRRRKTFREFPVSTGNLRSPREFLVSLVEWVFWTLKHVYFYSMNWCLGTVVFIEVEVVGSLNLFLICFKIYWYFMLCWFVLNYLWMCAAGRYSMMILIEDRPTSGFKRPCLREFLVSVVSLRKTRSQTKYSPVKTSNSLPLSVPFDRMIDVITKPPIHGQKLRVEELGISKPLFCPEVEKSAPKKDELYYVVNDLRLQNATGQQLH